MSTYSHRFFKTALIAVPLLLWFFGCNTIDNSTNAPPESKMAKSSKNTQKEINIEAEDKKYCSWIRSSSVDNNHSGYKGKGFVNTPNHTGAWMQCKVKVPAADSYRIEVRYANGSSGRAAQLIVNGRAKATGKFASTGNWKKWNDEIFKNIPLKAGTNTIRLSAKTSGGLGNIDYFSYVQGEGSNKKSKNIVVNFKNNYDIPCKIDPIYINGSGDNITLPDQKCDGWKPTSFYVPGKGSRNPGDKVFINKSMTVIAEWLEMDEDQSSGKKVDNTKINIEAEDKKYCSWIRSSSVDNNHRGYTGKGFVNTPNQIGAWMKCKVKVQVAGSYRIEVRYANGSSGRAVQLIVNGRAKATGTFASTGNWKKWNDEIFKNIPLNAGTNTVQLSAITWGGLSNIDHFDISR